METNIVNKKIFKKRGIILIEAILAMAVVVIIMTALITALVSAMNSTRFSEDQTIATGYAQEGMELVRNQKNADFGAFKDAISGNSYDLGPGNDIDSRFERVIYANLSGIDRDGQQYCEQDNDGLDSIYVASIVSWNSSRCSSSAKCHEVVLESCITNVSYNE